MKKLVTSIFTILLLICSQLTFGAGQDEEKLSEKISGRIDIGNNLYTLASTVKEVHDYYFPEEAAVAGTEGEFLITELKTVIDQEMLVIQESLNDLPDMIQHSLQKHELMNHFLSLQYIFEDVVRDKRRTMGLDKSLPYDDEEFIKFKRVEHFKNVETHFSFIRNTLTGNTAVINMIRNFLDSLQKFEGVCDTHVSYAQLLGYMLKYLKIASVQYYVTKDALYDLIDDSDNFGVRRTATLNSIYKSYQNDATFFKDLMMNASTAIYACQPENGYNDETYTELKFYSDYFVKQQYIDRFDSTVFPILYPYNETLVKDPPASQVRPCGDDLYYCEEFNPKSPTYFCLNNERNYKRYTSVVKNREDFSCEGVTEKQSPWIKPTNFWSADVLRIIPEQKLMKCVCPEKKYYVRVAEVTSDVKENKVITGARLVVINDVIHVQIEEGILGANGTIKAGSTRWKPTPADPKNVVKSEENGYVPIAWNITTSFSLRKPKIMNNQILVGLLLYPFGSRESRMLQLIPYVRDFDFKTGTLGDYDVHNYLTYVEKDFYLSNPDVPTKAKVNPIHSKDDEYVRLRPSDLQKDGGQSMVPFIDTQIVKPAVPVPLTGAQLFVKTQHGFGGFLGIKLFTLNMAEHISIK